MIKVRNFEQVASTAPDTLLLRQSFSHWSGKLRSLALVAAGGFVCAPLILIASDTAAAAELARKASLQPSTLLTFITLGTIGLAAMTCGLLHLMRPCIRNRIVRIAGDQVTVFERTDRQDKIWREPLGAYVGIRHRVATTSAGARHFLMLEHPDPARALLIAYQPHIGDDAIKAMAEILKRPILSTFRGSIAAWWIREYRIGAAGASRADGMAGAAIGA